jgi:hypothetical protein
MRTLVLSPMIVLFFIFVSIVNAKATSCSQIHQFCLKNCADKYAKSPRCTVFCGEALPKCISTGCFVTPQANKCGLSKN